LAGQCLECRFWRCVLSTLRDDLVCHVLRYSWSRPLA
jgi:hypothetical protein